MSNPNIQPLAQDFVVAAQVPDPARFFFHDPNLIRLGDGALLIAAPQWERYGFTERRLLRMLRSGDGGLTWRDLPELPYEEGTPFVLDGRLLMFVQEKSHVNLLIVASDDGGHTWTRPVTIFEGPVWTISTARVERPDSLFWAMDVDLPGVDYGGKVMARLDRAKSPLDPGAWRLSNVVQPPDFPKTLSRLMFPPHDRASISGGWLWPFIWLEPNTVEVGGRIRVFARCVMDEYATAHIAAVLDYDVATGNLSFVQFTAWPGGQCKFFIVHDPVRSVYWMMSNLVTNSQDLLGWSSHMRESGYHGGPGNERRWLFLHYSIDCLNWFPAGCVARWPDSVRRSFMYPSVVIDGEDLVALSRTSRDSGHQHDADLCTIHRIRNFRSLAMDLRTGRPGAA